jgi:DNA repair protein RadC
MKELPDLERPYEKLEKYGEKSLSNAELLAIILKTGTKEETALQLAHRILNECGMKKHGLSLKNISLTRLMEIKGIGRVKAILLALKHNGIKIMILCAVVFSICSSSSEIPTN